MDEDRMYREKFAIVSRVRVKMGSSMSCQSPITDQIEVDWLASKPRIGNDSAKTWMRMSPRKNDGIEYTMNAALVATLSPSVFRFTAWKMPSGNAIRMASSREIPDR